MEFVLKSLTLKLLQLSAKIRMFLMIGKSLIKDLKPLNFSLKLLKELNLSFGMDLLEFSSSLTSEVEVLAFSKVSLREQLKELPQ